MNKQTMPLAKHLINVEGLYKKYDNSSEFVISNLTTSFGKQKIITVLGKSGCGKSTLLKVIVGIIQPDRGTITRNGKIGYIAQEKNHFPWLTVKKNITLGLENEKESDISDVLRQVGLYEYSNWYPSKLSGGLKQRIPIARELLRKRDVLLMDEPFSALDKTSKRNLYHLLSELKERKGCTIIVVTHDVEEALEISDDIMIFEGEKVSKYRLFSDVSYKREDVRKQLEKRR